MNQIVKALQEQAVEASKDGYWKLENLCRHAALEIEVKEKRIEQLEAMLTTIVSIPAVRDIELSLMTIPESNNPITDARKMVAT